MTYVLGHRKHGHTIHVNYSPCILHNLDKRHAGHRRDRASATGGLGAHYFEHHGGSTNTMLIMIIDYVAPSNHSALDY